MTELSALFHRAPRILGQFLWHHKLHLLALVLIGGWCIPYFATGDKIEWGDFSFFAQAHQAMRISILDYHQFPWFNPWVSGGVPLYANPQMGVFSISLLFTLFFGAPLGLKLALVIYTIAGYGSMFLLARKFFKIDTPIAVLLSLLWIFCSFFVAHLPAHYTFAWYMLTPLFVYLALTVHTWKKGLLLGLAFAVMALAQVHNPFVHISLVCGVIIAVRLVRAFLQKKDWQALLRACLGAGTVFVVLAGHRVLLTFQNIHNFPREVIDPAPNPFAALLGPLLPLSMAHPLKFITYPQPPTVPHGWHEVTATIGVFGIAAALMCVLYLTHQLVTRKKLAWQQHKMPLALLGVAILCASLALGSFAPFAPYALMKHLPVLADMRVPMRWFLGFDLALLMFIGVMLQKAGKKSYLRFSGLVLLSLGVIELFALNAGYQRNILVHQPVKAPQDVRTYQFEQTSYFGETRALPTGGEIPNDGNMPHAYREYEATLYNFGILYANDALVQLALDPRPSPTCPWEEGCDFVLSHNAKVTFWSPNKIVLQRTDDQPISLNMNNSNYFLINGHRDAHLKVAEPFQEFIIRDPAHIITIEAKPSLNTLLH